MIVYDCPQGSQEWLACRAGVITASMFKVARERVGMLTSQQKTYVDALLSGLSESAAKSAANYKNTPTAECIQKALAGEKVGDFSDSAKRYARQVALERIAGKPLNDGFQTWAMRRGQEMEPEARRVHESRKGLLVESAGFVTTDDGVFGASADGFIDDDGGVEYKCLIDADRICLLWLDNNMSEFMDQIQGGMWITGRRYWEFAMYCPDLGEAGLDLYTRRIDRDDNHIEALESDLIEFKGLVDHYEMRLREAK